MDLSGQVEVFCFLRKEQFSPAGEVDMEIKKILNNNVVITVNEHERELVVMGRGLAFQKKVGQHFDKSKVEKTFVLETEGISDKLAVLLQDIPELYLNLAYKIADHARTQLSYPLNEYIYVALTDHLSFAVSRHRENIQLTNPLLWEIRKYYRQEFIIGQQALEMIKAETGIELPEDEAASIALHLVNSQLSGENMDLAVQMTEMVNSILTIVKYHFSMELDEHSVNYERFLTHLRFFAIRYIREEKVTEQEDSFLYEQLLEKYPEAFACTKKVRKFLGNKYGWEISKDEEIYLMLHIQRVTKRHVNTKTTS